MSACVSYYQDKVVKARNDNDRVAQRQAQMHVSVLFILDFCVVIWQFFFQLRLFQNEMSVEEIIREKTQTIFYQKCRDHQANVNDSI